MRNIRDFSRTFYGIAFTCFFALSCVVVTRCVWGQQAVPRSEATPGAKATPKSTSDSTASKVLTEPALPVPVGAKKLSPTYPIWLDSREKTVLVDGQICLREGMLEMFACTRNTKEHEAIVSANTKAYLVHAGLLSLGAEAGHPVQFQPTYKPAAGTEIDVFVRWRDAQGREQTARAQDWIRDVRTKKPMSPPFVFGGSSFWTDPDSGKKSYQAEGGDFVCVSNFGTAMLDLPVKSSQANDELEFEAFAEKIPPLGTPVRLVFKPKLKARGAGGDEQGEKPGDGKATHSTEEVK